MFGIGAGEFIVILIVGLIVFGPGKLPEVGRAIGKGLREFRKAQAEISKTLNEVDISEKNKPPADKKSVSADEMINLAKESPIVKENCNEKVSDSANFSVNADRAGNSSAGSSSNSIEKQS